MSRQRHRYVAARPLPVSPSHKLGPRRWAYHQPVYRRSTLATVFRWLVWLAVGVAAVAIVATVGYKLWVDAQTEGLIYDYDDPELPRSHVAIVFGAGLNRSGGPSAILEDRVKTGADLYSAGVVDKLLMTGDNSSVEHNEVEAMRQTAIELGVPDGDIVLDYAGFNTWDSCYRAREVFGLAEATLVTQRFHLPRALHTCKELGIDVVGVVADRQVQPTSASELREYVALAGTAFRFLINDKPRFLGPKVNIDEPQKR